MREQILQGKLGLPSYSKFSQLIGAEYTNLADKMFQAMWNAYLLNKGTISLPYWYDRFNNPTVFNQVLISLAKGNWTISHAVESRNWAEARLNEDKLLEFCTQTELEQVRAHNKFKQYRMTNEPSTVVNKTKVNGKVKHTGLVRTGFAKAGNTQFSIDTELLDSYSMIISANLTKSMDKIARLQPNLRHDAASYDAISVDILNYHLANPGEVFTRGSNYSDSRGRAISSCLAKVANPISNKDFRALLVIV